MTDDEGDEISSIEYYPYGEWLESASEMPTDRLFTGQHYDDTGLYYYGARYYDPVIGRFISADTIVSNPAKPQSFKRYSFCLNNPLKYIDPSGHAVGFSSDVVTIVFDKNMQYLDPWTLNGMSNVIRSDPDMFALFYNWTQVSTIIGEATNYLIENDTLYTIKFGQTSGGGEYVSDSNTIIINNMYKNPTYGNDIVTNNHLEIIIGNTAHEIGHAICDTDKGENSILEESGNYQVQFHVLRQLGYDPKPADFNISVTEALAVDFNLIFSLDGSTLSNQLGDVKQRWLKDNVRYYVNLPLWQSGPRPAYWGLYIQPYLTGDIPGL
ncbi:MAG: RHS repeat-associated core domain-containing protein [Dehalococcoidales bacterium]|nr:RHS repeat-associated core domain-containing protein [Dehalococcoidales bacterium]